MSFDPDRYENWIWTLPEVAIREEIILLTEHIADGLYKTPPLSQEQLSELNQQYSICLNAIRNRKSG